MRLKNIEHLIDASGNCLLDDDMGSNQGLVWCGEWSSNNTYNKGDIVRSNGSIYICVCNLLKSHSNPENDRVSWDLFVSNGNDRIKQIEKNVRLMKLALGLVVIIPPIIGFYLNYYLKNKFFFL
jgi:hypothetical protein